MQIDFFFFPLWVFKCKKGEISLCTPMPELRTERSHSSFQCAWKESAELGHQMSKKLRFFTCIPSWPRPEQKNHQSLEKMCFVQNSETSHKKCAKSNLIIKGYEQIFDKASNLQNPQSGVFLIIIFNKTVLIQFEYFFFGDNLFLLHFVY